MDILKLFKARASTRHVQPPFSVRVTPVVLAGLNGTTTVKCIVLTKIVSNLPVRVCSVPSIVAQVPVGIVVLVIGGQNWSFLKDLAQRVHEPINLGRAQPLPVTRRQDLVEGVCGQSAHPDMGTRVVGGVGASSLTVALGIHVLPVHAVFVIVPTGTAFQHRPHKLVIVPWSHSKVKLIKDLDVLSHLRGLSIVKRGG
jgi:hypothetical protein